MKDILIFMSDQHGSAFENTVRTPNLDEMRKNGTSFDACYTPCPLCVPARMAVLSSRLPSETGIFNNKHTLGDDVPTIADAFGKAGYETVLIGRMHFVGENQRHGFEKRLVGDITSPFRNPHPELDKKIKGEYGKCFAEGGCLSFVGPGRSPVIEYDEDVVKAAIEYLALPHDRPQFIVVGTYAPHFPYIAPKDLYDYYASGASLPYGFLNPPDYLDPILTERRQRSGGDEETALRAVAAYSALIEFTDYLVGKVRKAFAGRGLFAYMSDHGDMCGERGLYAKMAFFDSASRVPLIFEGPGIEKGRGVKSPVSIIDLWKTLSSYASIPAPESSEVCDILSPDYPGDRPVISEMFGVYGSGKKAAEGFDTLSRMVRKGGWKFITRSRFEEYDILFDMNNDPGETVNRIGEYPEIADELREVLAQMPSDDDVRVLIDNNDAECERLKEKEEVNESMLSDYWHAEE